MHNRTFYQIRYIAVGLIIPTTVLLALFATVSGLLLPVAVFLLFGGFVLIALLRQPVAFVYLVPLLFSVEYRVYLGFVSFTLAEFSVALVWLAAIVRSLSGRRRRVNFDQIELLSLFCIMLAALPGVFLEQDVKRALSVYRDFIMPLLLWAGFLLADLDRGQITKLIKAYLLVATVSAVLGVVQSQTGDFLWLGPTVEYMGRKMEIAQTPLMGFLGQNAMAVGLYNSGNNFAWYLVMPVLASATFGMLPALKRWEKWLWRASSVVLLVALLSTFSRASLLTLLTAWGLFLWFHRRRHITITHLFIAGSLLLSLWVLVVASGLISLGDFEASITGRRFLLNTALSLLQDHPEALIAGGFTEDYFQYGTRQVVHNLALYVIIQFGLPTLLSWLFFVVVQLNHILGLVRAKDEELRYLGLTLFSGLAVIVFFYEQTSNSIATVQNALQVFFWMGVGSYLYRFHQAELAGEARHGSYPVNSQKPVSVVNPLIKPRSG